MRNHVVLLLMIDNDEDFTAVWRYIFSQKGFDVVVASGISKVKRALHANRPDIIICDISSVDDKMAEFCRYVRSLSLHRKTPVIIVGELGDEEKRGLYLAAGASAYIEKPFCKSDIFNLFEKLLPEKDSTTITNLKKL